MALRHLVRRWRETNLRQPEARLVLFETPVAPRPQPHPVTRCDPPATAQPSLTLGDALNAGFGFLEVKCAGCETQSAIDLTIVRRPKHTPIWRLEQSLRCGRCSEQRGYA